MAHLMQKYNSAECGAKDCKLSPSAHRATSHGTINGARLGFGITAVVPSETVAHRFVFSGGAGNASAQR